MFPSENEQFSYKADGLLHWVSSSLVKMSGYVPVSLFAVSCIFNSLLPSYSRFLVGSYETNP